MSDEERNQLLALLDQANEEAKGYSPEQAKQKLIDEGFCVENGEVWSMSDSQSA